MDSEIYYVKHYAAEWQRAVNGRDERFASLHPQFARLMKCECLQSRSQWLLQLALFLTYSAQSGGGSVTVFQANYFYCGSEEQTALYPVNQLGHAHIVDP